jgi:hypothetical protein
MVVVRQGFVLQRIPGILALLTQERIAVLLEPCLMVHHQLSKLSQWQYTMKGIKNIMMHIIFGTVLDSQGTKKHHIHHSSQPTKEVDTTNNLLPVVGISGWRDASHLTLKVLVG